MVQLRLTIVLVIGVLLVCTANPISSEENPTKLFSADQLQRAKNAGLREARLVEGLEFGLTFEEILKFHELRSRNTHLSKEVTAESVIMICEILTPELKMATSFTSAQETQIPELFLKMKSVLSDYEIFGYIRSTVCEYASQPDKLDMEANSFGLSLVNYLGNRYMKMKAQKAVGVERVKVAKLMCCLHDNRAANNETVLLDQSKFTGLPDGQLTEFDGHWKDYETENTLKSFENVCDFLKTTDQTEDDCVVAIAIPLLKATEEANE